jgi:hypothetical protein
MLKCTDVSTQSYRKGSFLYLPKSEILGKGEGNKFYFKINKSMFKGNNTIFENYEVKKNEITEKIAQSIRFEFKDTRIEAISYGEKIEIDFSRLEHTDKNARRLIDVVEFAKTLFLAIA